MCSRQKPGRRPERAELASTAPPVRPHSSRSSRFARRERLLARARACPPAARRAACAPARAAGGRARAARSRVDGDDRDRAGMLDDLALVVAPALERDVDQLAVVDGARLVGLHAASRSTSARSLGAEPRRLAGGGVLGGPLRPRGRGNRDVDPLVGEHPLEERLRPGLDAERAQRLERRARSAARRTSAPSPSGRMTMTATPSSAASGSSSRSTSRSCGLYGSCTTSKRRVRSASRELAERARRVVRHAELVDAALLALRLEPLELLAPGDEVVDLLDLDAAEPFDAAARYCSRPSSTDCAQIFVATVALVAAPVERRAERRLGAAVHRRRVEDAGSPASSAAPTTLAASAASAPNVFQVPRPTTGPRRRSSISGARGVDERERHVDHRVEVRDGDALVRACGCRSCRSRG